jgi:stage II sporulation protein D
VTRVDPALRSHRGIGLLASLLVISVLVALAAPASAAEFEGDRVEISVSSEGYLELNDRRYRGPFVVTAESDGLAFVERVGLEAYLEGIREVPFSWERHALAAQAVAARTYLAWTLSEGRTGAGRRIGYDICATAACQVYAGVEAVLGPEGDRWRAAVAATAGEILIFEGTPARAFYSSTTGGRTRNIEDIWPGSAPAPYLVGVPSPGEESPFVEWSWELPAFLMHRLLEEADVASGEIQSVTSRTTEDGEGPWMVDIVSDSGTVSLDTWELRARINRAASIMPLRLPATNDEGRVYPTTILSPQYTIRSEIRIGRFHNEVYPNPHYVVEGGGWGHLIGMSQFGAQAMAESGATYPEILAHYYGGLTPVPGESFLPDDLLVGLMVGADSVSVSSDSLLRADIDGEVHEAPAPGVWEFDWEDGRIRVKVPRANPPLVPPGPPLTPF